ncbi:hypothetical protein [Streptomyces canus]|uniref:hypothetical protein n=1 Tax=Streptomyces canus TaxID=58343 RepID=UPI0018F888CD
MRSTRTSPVMSAARPKPLRIRVPRTGVGRPRCRPDERVAEKTYSSRGFRAYLRKRGTTRVSL